MSYFGNVNINYGQPSVDAGGRLRVSQLTTLADLKILNADSPLLLENSGTGTGTYASNKFTMSVTSGQFYVRQSRRFYPYLSGKSSIIECTFSNFESQANTTKRVGYFSSNAVSPFDTTLDGFWLENDGTTIRLRASRAGTSTLNIAWTSWLNYNLISSYNWANFTVIFFDFLWLGGAVLRLFIKVGNTFVLAHQFDYAGTETDVFILSPNQPVRYELRSSTGTGSFVDICSQASTEGSVSESGKGGSVNTGSTAIACNAIGTKYPLKAIRKKTAFGDVAVKVISVTAFVNSADQGLLTVELNPTLSAGLTYSDVTNYGVQEANGNGTITVTSAGTILFSQVITQNSTINAILVDEFYSWLGSTLANVMGEIVVCFTPITATVSTFATINFKEY